MKLKMCNCSMCKRGRKSSWNQTKIKTKKSSARSQVKVKLKKGFWDKIQETIKIGYTD